MSSEFRIGHDQFSGGDMTLNSGAGEPRVFVLVGEDIETGCPALESRFAVQDLAALRSIIGQAGEGDPDLRHSYAVDCDQLSAIRSTTGVRFDPGRRPVRLEPWHNIRSAPYLVHTEFELVLMLECRKPLSVFEDVSPLDWFDAQMERFDRNVASGHLRKREFREPFSEPRELADGRSILGLRKIYFCLPGQEWRIDAHRALWQSASLSGWTEAHESEEGRLLGYESWQVDWWLAYRRQSHGPSR